MKKAVVVSVALGLAFAASAVAKPGALDRSFGDGGLVTVNSTDDGAHAVDIGRKGRIVAAGLHAVARRLPDGRPDRSFGKRGVVRLDSGPYANGSVAFGSTSVAVGPKGSVFTAG